MICTSFWSWFWMFSVPGTSHHFDNAQECGVNLKMKAQIMKQELSEHDVQHIHSGAVHGHMDTVGTMVTEFFTAVALQHFHMLGRIALCMYSATVCTKWKCCFSVSPAPPCLIFRPGQSSDCCKTFLQSYMFFEKDVLFYVQHGKPHTIQSA